MTLNLAIEDSLREFLASQDVEMLTPRKRMMELKSVPIGTGFSKPCTNLLLLTSSKLVRVLMADLIDRDVRLIGVTQPGFDPRRLRSSGSLPRRVEFVWLDGAQPFEMLRVIAKRLQSWPLSQNVDVLPEAIAAAVALSSRASAIEPAGSMGLLESVLIDARERGLRLVGPDEVFHTYGRIHD